MGKLNSGLRQVYLVGMGQTPQYFRFFVGNMAIGSKAMDRAEIFRTCSPRRLSDRSENGTLIIE